MRVRELIEPLGFRGGKTIVDDYLREVRPLFLAPQDVPAHGVSAGGDLPVGFVGALGAGAGRAWPAAAGVGRGGVHGLVSCRGWRADLQQGGTGCAVGHEPLFVEPWRAAGAVGVGPRGVPARWRRAPDRGLCGVSAGSCRSTGTSAKPQTRRPRVSSSGCRSIWRATSSPAGSSPTTSTSSCSSTAGLRRPTAGRTA